MVWGGISWKAKTPLAFCSSKIDAVVYIEMLDDVYQPWVASYYPCGIVFQQDNAPAHSAIHKKDYFLSEAMDVLPWPAKSPDLNCIENVWGLLVQRVYEGRRQFDTIEDLKECLIYEWGKLTIDKVRKFIFFMPCRIVECMANRGGITKY